MKNIFLSALYFIPALAFSKVPFTIQGVEVDQSKVERFTKGIELFRKSVSNDCGIDFNYSVSDYRELDSKGTPFKSDHVLKEYKTKYGRAAFKYFQKPLYDFLNHNGALESNKGVVLNIVPDVYGHCGYAFPDVQFSEMNNSKVHNKLRNNVLLSLGASDCGSLSRLVAHELSHIFIQDDPPHKCQGRDCPKSNILSVFRYVEQGPRRPGRMGNNFDPFGAPDFFAPSRRQLPSVGLEINSDQCLRIEKTLLKNRWL